MLIHSSSMRYSFTLATFLYTPSLTYAYTSVPRCVLFLLCFRCQTTEHGHLSQPPMKRPTPGYLCTLVLLECFLCTEAACYDITSLACSATAAPSRETAPCCHTRCASFISSPVASLVPVCEFYMAFLGHSNAYALPCDRSCAASSRLFFLFHPAPGSSCQSRR